MEEETNVEKWMGIIWLKVICLAISLWGEMMNVGNSLAYILLKFETKTEIAHYPIGRVLQ